MSGYLMEICLEKKIKDLKSNQCASMCAFLIKCIVFDFVTIAKVLHLTNLIFISVFHHQIIFQKQLRGNWPVLIFCWLIDLIKSCSLHTVLVAKHCKRKNKVKIRWCLIWATPLKFKMKLCLFGFVWLFPKLFKNWIEPHGVGLFIDG